MKFRFYYHKIEYDEYNCEADTLEAASEKAVQYLQAITNDYYHGGEWFISQEVTQL